MGMVDQVYGERVVVPLRGPLAEIQRILNRVQNPDGGLSHEQALAAIAKLVDPAAKDGPVYQKPWG